MQRRSSAASKLGLNREFAKLGVEFAYPTQKLFVATLPEQEP
jgi:hypothetical protein